MDNDVNTSLLQEIRDLLIPITAHYQPEYEERLQIQRREKALRLAQMVKGRQARSACLMMDGSNEQSKIREMTGIASGNLSPLITRLGEEGMLTADSDRNKPALIFSKTDLEEIFGG